MDKILLTAFLTALAGFITAALSIVKLVNEKESKTTEYRQAWTDSVRSALAELIAKITSQASIIVSARKMGMQLSKSSADKANQTGVAAEERKILDEFYRGLYKDSFDAANLHTREIHYAYAKVRLHFKPDDLSFNRVENKVEFCINKISEIKHESNPEKLLALKEQVHSAVNEITSFSRQILKKEWETVKLGEPAYKKTKQWSVWICVIMFFVLLTIGTHAAISYAKSSDLVISYAPLQPIGESASIPNRG